MTRTVLIWILAAVITLASVVYQRMTGPTYPKRGNVEIAGETIKYKLLRTHDTTSDAEISIEVPENVTGEIRWKRFKSYDTWTTEPLPRDGDALVFGIPKQPSAGKVMYNVTLIDENGVRHKLTDEPVIIRFKGPVPKLALYPHIFFMFIAMLLSTRTCIEAVAGRPRAFVLTLWTSGFFLVGGMIFGPIVQKYAFGAFWTGWPFGHDLTDNKILVAFIFWIVALYRARKRGEGRGWIIAASVVTFLVYLIPHSVLGSEIDYTKIGG